jgi:hypothetical protein
MRSISQALALCAVLALVWPGLAAAEQSRDLGEYVVHYNAITTDFLTPQVARAYGITRSKNRGMINVTVLKKQMGLGGQPQRAQITVAARNLNNQTKTVQPREVNEAGAIYYIAEFPISDRETVEFNLTLAIEEGPTEVFSFRQQFFTR